MVQCSSTYIAVSLLLLWFEQVFVSLVPGRLEDVLKFYFRADLNTVTLSQNETKS